MMITPYSFVASEENIAELYLFHIVRTKSLLD